MIAIALIVITSGLMCTCVATSKKTYATFEKNLHELKAELRTASTLPKEKQEELRERATKTIEKWENSYMATRLFCDAAENLGNTFNHSRSARLWDAFFNKSFLGRLFTQAVLMAPMTVLVNFLTTTCSFIARDTYEHWVAAQSDPVKARNEGVAALFVFLISVEAARSMIISYSRVNQGDLVEGRNLED